MIAAGLLFAAPASAHKLTLGKAAPFGSGDCTNCQPFQLDTTRHSPSYAVPHGKWKIVSWKATGGTIADAQARLLVYRPTAMKGQFKLFDESGEGSVPMSTRLNHNTNIRVRQGDLLGLQSFGSMPTSYESPFADVVGSTQPGCTAQVGDILGTGTACPVNTFGGSQVNIAAKLVKRH